uniref:Uncharacterized protein n=1 Tax=Arundo donax TaxID=35708 RepID=A0A0A9A6H2_ARUDO
MVIQRNSNLCHKNQENGRYDELVAIFPHSPSIWLYLQIYIDVLAKYLESSISRLHNHFFNRPTSDQ